MSVDVRQLTPDDVALLKALLATFGEAFDDVDTYSENRPSAGYLRRLLAGDSFIALAALKSGNIVGGIAAYELKKFEQERSEIYIYDRAVLAAHRREGTATPGTVPNAAAVFRPSPSACFRTGQTTENRIRSLVRRRPDAHHGCG